MANMNAAPNVWSQMSYVPPRGNCNFRASIVSPKCPCLRFMLHPLKSASSYECDGCAHHASFHSMENKFEDEIRKRWEVEAKEKQEQEERQSANPRKRLRELEYAAVSRDEFHIGLTETTARKSKAPAKRAVKARTAATRAKGKVTEILDEDDELEELDVD